MPSHPQLEHAAVIAARFAIICALFKFLARQPMLFTNNFPFVIGVNLEIFVKNELMSFIKTMQLASPVDIISENHTNKMSAQ